MKTQGIIVLIAAILAFALDYLPLQVVVLFYAFVGVTIGAIFPKVNTWAQRGLTGAASGFVAWILVDQVMPEFVKTATVGMTGFDVFLIKLTPFILKVGLIWGGISTLLRAFKRYTKQR
jgi:hypothetical protein